MDKLPSTYIIVATLDIVFFNFAGMIGKEQCYAI